MASTDLQVVERGNHTVVINEPDEKKAILIMDRMDLQQAMAELQGDVVSKFVYMAKGKRQLSYLGIKEAARMYRNVHFGATATPIPDGGWMIISYAHNLADNTKVEYPMPYPAFNPSNPEESITFRATLSKSLRNALAAVLPVTYLETMINRWIEQQGGVPSSAPRNVTPARQQGAISEPAGQEQLISEPAEAAEYRKLDDLLGKDAEAARDLKVWLDTKGLSVADLSIGDVRKTIARLEQRAIDRAITPQETSTSPEPPAAATASELAIPERTLSTALVEQWERNITWATEWLEPLAKRKPNSGELITGGAVLAAQTALLGAEATEPATESAADTVAAVRRNLAVMSQRLIEQMPDDEPAGDDSERIDAEIPF